jgi:hypothetical protein
MGRLNLRWTDVRRCKYREETPGPGERPMTIYPSTVNRKRTGVEPVRCSVNESARKYSMPVFTAWSYAAGIKSRQSHGWQAYRVPYRTLAVALSTAQIGRARWSSGFCVDRGTASQVSTYVLPRITELVLCIIRQDPRNSASDQPARWLGVPKAICRASHHAEHP